MRRVGYIILAFIFFILIGCGSSSGLSSGTEAFVIHKYLKDDGNVSAVDINVSLNWNYADYYATDSNITVTLGNFKITKFVCKEGDQTDTLHYTGDFPTITFRGNESAYAVLSIQFQREPTDPTCTDIQYIALSADENVTITVYDKTLTKQKKWVKVIENPNYGNLTLEDIYTTPEANETNESGVYTYDRKLTNSKIAVVRYEKDFPDTYYAGNIEYPYFSNTNFNETNMSISDWILVKDKYLAFEVVDLNSTDQHVIVVNPNINKGKLESGSYDIMSTLKECTYTPKNLSQTRVKFGYYCPNEENLSKIFVVEYNATDAIYTSLNTFAQ